MIHLYSKGCEYALQALMNIDREQCRDGFSVSSVCKKACLPESFTRKAFQTLVKHRVLKAKRGPGGGYRFSGDPAKISLLKVVNALDGKRAFDKCVMKNCRCDQTRHCSLHPMWMKTKAGLIEQLKRSTVADLIGS